jgi:hypothetical protein
MKPRKKNIKNASHNINGKNTVKLPAIQEKDASKVEIVQVVRRLRILPFLTVEARIV